MRFTYLSLCVLACVGVYVRVREGVSGRVSACSLAYPTSIAMRHIVMPFVAPLAHLIFRDYLIKATIFENKALNTKFVFLFLLQIYLKYFSS
jgi:hypothetical protein